MEDDGIIGNADLIPFYQRPDIIEKMKRVYDRHSTATIRARAKPSNRAKETHIKQSPLRLDTFHW